MVSYLFIRSKILNFQPDIADKTCVHNKPLDRSLPFWAYTDPKANDPFECSAECHRKGFQYSGVQFGTECYCGMKAPPRRYLADNNQCNTKCSSGWKINGAYGILFVCGGHEKANVYKTKSKNFKEQEQAKTGETRKHLCALSCWDWLTD